MEVFTNFEKLIKSVDGIILNRAELKLLPPVARDNLELYWEMNKDCIKYKIMC